MIAPFHFAGEALQLDPAGALVWPAARLLVVADLHLEKGSAAARGGQLVPPWDSRVTLERLAALLRRYAPRTVVGLGDSFHDDHGPARLAAADAAALRRMTDAVEFVWVRGNHDKAPPAGIGGRAVESFAVGALTFRHEAAAGVRGEISGHFHPKARVVTRAGQVVRPCFMTDARKIMLPAFGAYTGGLDVLTPAIAAHFPRGGRVFLLGGERLFSFPVGQVQAAPPPGAGLAEVPGARRRSLP
jgi:DNA ligase-associated metallophosphoesterase